MKNYLLLLIIMMLSSASGFAQNLDSAIASMFNRNLIVNPGAENRTSGLNGWESITLDPQGSPMVGTGSYITSPSTEMGSNYFRSVVGGPQGETSAYQYVDLSAMADLIDRGVIYYNMNGNFGGGDYATSLLGVQFLSGSGKTMKSYYTKNILLEEVGADSLNIYPTGKTDKVPKGTRKMIIQLRFYKYGDMEVPVAAYADNLSVTLYKK